MEACLEMKYWEEKEKRKVCCSHRWPNFKKKERLIDKLITKN